MTDEHVLDFAILAEENIHQKPLSEELYTRDKLINKLTVQLPVMMVLGAELW